MKSRKVIFVLAGALLFGNIFAQPDRPVEKKVVDTKGRRAFPVAVGDSTVTAFVGDVVYYHNGAVITCDSAVRYSDRRLECFGNVLINKDSTYVYGDRAEYNDDTSLARVFSPLIKMVDGDAVLYTYNFMFDTKNNIGQFSGGGTMSQNETLLESDRGYYYADTKDIICVGNVELRDETYLIKSDSLGFNTETEIAEFFMQTYIWNDKGEILSTNRGFYYTADEHYRFTKDAYVMTDNQEIWADDIDYKADIEDVIMRRNVQIRDDDQQILAFGDFGQYWGESGDAMLTERPSVIYYELEEGSDSLYMRADSIFMYVIDSTSIYHPDYVGNKPPEKGDKYEEELLDEFMQPRAKDTTTGTPETEGDGELNEGDPDDPDRLAEDALNTAGDEVPPMEEGESSTDAPQIPPPEAESPPLTEGEQDTALEQVSGEGAGESELQPEEVPAVQKQLTKKELRKQKRAEKKAAKEAAKQAKKKVVSKVTDTPGEAGDTDALAQTEGTDEDAGRDDTVATDQVGDAGEEEDEKDRVIVAYRNVKIYREDFQAICDSLLAYSIDSTAHLHISPVMWNGENQITSELAVIYTKDEQLEKAVFSGGSPIMGSKLDRTHYNQVAGKVIEAHFQDNEIYRTDAIGNGQSYYYIQDDDTGDLQGFLVIECADISFMISGRNVDSIIFRVNPVYAIYPMDKIPDDQPLTMPGFNWVGDMRPVKSDVFNRVIRSSRREEYMELPTPLFLLTDKIHDRKRELIESGIWQDRTEDISRDAQQFIEQVERREGIYR